MLKRLIKIKSQYPELLSYLVSAQSESPYNIVEAEGGYCLSFSDSIDQGNVEKAKQVADVVIAHLNAILQLPQFGITKALERENEDVITIDDNGKKIGQSTKGTSVLVKVGPNFTTIDFSNLLEIEAKANSLSWVKQALRYYGQGINWFSLYDIYECLRKDIEELEGREIPEQWLMDSHGRNRLDDFTESANNYNISGYIARHTEAESKEIERINDKWVRLKKNGKEIMTMTLDEARKFIENLMMKWLKYRTIRF